MGALLKGFIRLEGPQWLLEKADNWTQFEQEDSLKYRFINNSSRDFLEEKILSLLHK